MPFRSGGLFFFTRLQQTSQAMFTYALRMTTNIPTGPRQDPRIGIVRMGKLNPGLFFIFRQVYYLRTNQRVASFTRLCVVSICRVFKGLLNRNAGCPFRITCHGNKNFQSLFRSNTYPSNSAQGSIEMGLEFFSVPFLQESFSRVVAYYRGLFIL